MRVAVYSLGCKVNIYESEVMKEKLLQAGFKETIDNSDIVIINTCSVTNMADVKSRKMIRREKKENPKSILAVCGCSAENHRLELEDLGIDILIGNKDKSNIVSLIWEYQHDHKPIIKFYDTRKLPFEDMKILAPIGYHEYLVQMYGDYMTPPPIAKQVSHHDLRYIDLTQHLSMEQIKKICQQ